MEKYAIDFLMAAAEQIPTATIIIVIYLIYLGITKGYAKIKSGYKAAGAHFEEVREEEERNEMVYKNHNDIENLTHKHEEDTHMFENRFNESDAKLNASDAKLDEIMNKLDVLAQKTDTQQQTINQLQCQLADHMNESKLDNQAILRNDIMQIYRRVKSRKPHHYILEEELKNYVPLFDRYGKANGNGYVHDIVDPFMRSVPTFLSDAEAEDFFADYED